ncbi:plasmid mobilization protein [Spirillospora sp. CA-108201]
MAIRYLIVVSGLTPEVITRLPSSGDQPVPWIAGTAASWGRLGVSDGVDGAEDTAVVDPPRPVRRRRVAGGRRAQCKVRFTAAEAERVAEAAAAAGMTVPNLVAETMLRSLEGGGGFSVVERRALVNELGKVRRLLTRVGANLNQLAAAANSGRAPAKGAVEATMDAVMRLVVRVDAVVSPLESRRR